MEQDHQPAGAGLPDGHYPEVPCVEVLGEGCTAEGVFSVWVPGGPELAQDAPGQERQDIWMSLRWLVLRHCVRKWQLQAGPGSGLTLGSER